MTDVRSMNSQRRYSLYLKLHIMNCDDALYAVKRVLATQRETHVREFKY